MSGPSRQRLAGQHVTIQPPQPGEPRRKIRAIAGARFQHIIASRAGSVGAARAARDAHVSQWTGNSRSFAQAASIPAAGTKQAPRRIAATRSA